MELNGVLVIKMLKFLLMYSILQFPFVVSVCPMGQLLSDCSLSATSGFRFVHFQKIVSSSVQFEHLATASLCLNGQCNQAV